MSQFGYDKRGQLTAAENTFEQDEAYAYDANGNRTGGSIVVQANNRLTSDATYTYTYDDEGNRTSRTHKGSGDKQDYTWDQRNRLVEVKFSNGVGMVAKKVRYDYDVFDRLVSRTEDSAYPFDYAGAPAELFVYDGDDVALDFLDADGVGTGAGATLQKRYLHGPAVDQVLAQEDVTLTAGNADRVLWHLTDNLGSTRDMLRSDGTTKAHLQYDSFGNLIDGLESVTRYQFTGREHDPDTGLQFNRRRWYDPQSGQWMSEDPIGFSAGDANLRRYVGNGPTNFTDPSGLDRYIGGVPPHKGVVVDVWDQDENGKWVVVGKKSFDFAVRDIFGVVCGIVAYFGGIRVTEGFPVSEWWYTRITSSPQEDMAMLAILQAAVDSPPTYSLLGELFGIGTPPSSQSNLFTCQGFADWAIEQGIKRPLPPNYIPNRPSRPGQGHFSIPK